MNNKVVFEKYPIKIVEYGEPSKLAVILSNTNCGYACNCGCEEHSSCDCPERQFIWAQIISWNEFLDRLNLFSEEDQKERGDYV